MSSAEHKGSRPASSAKDYTAFIALFNGLYNVSGGTEGAENALLFLKSGDADLKIQACVVVASKPAALLFEGQSKAMLRAGKKVKSVDPKLADYLPKFSDEEVAAMEPAKIGLMGKRRKDWNVAFKRVNLTQCRRIAFAAFTFCPADIGIPVILQWRAKFKDLNQASSFMTGQTKTIFEDQAIKFKSTQNLLESTGLSQYLFQRMPP